MYLSHFPVLYKFWKEKDHWTSKFYENDRRELKTNESVYGCKDTHHIWTNRYVYGGWMNGLVWVPLIVTTPRILERYDIR